MTAALSELVLNLIADTSKREVFPIEKIEYFIPLKKANVKKKLAVGLDYFLRTRPEPEDEEEDDRDEEPREMPELDRELEPEDEREGALKLRDGALELRDGEL
jgi:hypothetical protein